MIANKSRRVDSDDQELIDQINALKQDGENLYSILAIDVWALAKTMDEYQPGFWSDFMQNRDRALKRFMQEVFQKKSAPKQVNRPPFLR